MNFSSYTCLKKDFYCKILSKLHQPSKDAQLQQSAPLPRNIEKFMATFLTQADSPVTNFWTLFCSKPESRPQTNYG
jgi:hypothetical protein